MFTSRAPVCCSDPSAAPLPLEKACREAVDVCTTEGRAAGIDF